MKVGLKDTLCCLAGWEDNCLKPSEPSRTPAEPYSRFPGEQLRCNFSHPFSRMQSSSSLPLVTVKVMVTVRSWKVLVSCWKMGHLSLKCFTPTPKKTPHLMLISSQYLHTTLDSEHFSIFCSTPASLVFVFRLVTSSVLGTLGAHWEPPKPAQPCDVNPRNLCSGYPSPEEG